MFGLVWLCVGVGVDCACGLTCWGVLAVRCVEFRLGLWFWVVDWLLRSKVVVVCLLKVSDWLRLRSFVFARLRAT